MSGRHIISLPEYPNGDETTSMSEPTLDPDKIFIDRNGEQQWFCSSDVRHHQSYYFQGQSSRPKALSVGSVFNTPSSPNGFNSIHQFEPLLVDHSNSFIQATAEAAANARTEASALETLLFDDSVTSARNTSASSAAVIGVGEHVKENANSYDPLNFSLPGRYPESMRDEPAQSSRSNRALANQQQQRLQLMALHLATAQSMVLQATSSTSAVMAATTAAPSRLLFQHSSHQDMSHCDNKNIENDIQQLLIQSSGTDMEISGQALASTWILQLAMQQQQRNLTEIPDLEDSGMQSHFNLDLFHNEPDSLTSSPEGSTSFGHMSGRSRNSSVTTAGSGVVYPDVNKPKIATTFWEDENTVCYQVRARGVLVSRREDTDYVNGTKLLNVIGMTRGKRDGMLKTEKTRQVVKVGSMNLKGVWIPFERAAEIARNEGVSEILHPLFIRDLKSYYKTKGYRLRTLSTTGETELCPTSPSLNEPGDVDVEDEEDDDDDEDRQDQADAGEAGKDSQTREEDQQHQDNDDDEDDNDDRGNTVQFGTPVATNYGFHTQDPTMSLLSNDLAGFESLEGLNNEFSMIRCDLLEPQPALMDIKETFRLSYYTPAQIQSSDEAA